MRVTCDALDPDGQLPNQEARDIAALRQPPSQQLTDRQREILRLADEYRDAHKRWERWVTGEAPDWEEMPSANDEPRANAAYTAAALSEDK